MEGENSTSGLQPYQPYEAEVTNSPISNTPLWESEPPNSPFFEASPAEASKLPRLLHGAVPYEADQTSRGLSTVWWLCFCIPFVPARGHPRLVLLLYRLSPPEAIHGWLSFVIPFVPARGYPRLAILFYTVCPRPRLSTVGYPFLYRLPSPEAIHGWLSFYIPFALARGCPRFSFGSTATLASKAYIHGLI